VRARKALSYANLATDCGIGAAKMRRYLAAALGLVALGGAPALAADLPTKKQAPEEIVAPD
jgi:hypothetical protein